MYEQPISPENERIEKQTVINQLKDGGEKNPQAMEVLIKWIDQEQDRIDKIQNPEERDLENIKHIIEHSNILKEARLFEQAWSNLNESLYLAQGYKNSELLNQMKHLMADLEQGDPD